jgi:hypothetical protein
MIEASALAPAHDGGLDDAPLGRSADQDHPLDLQLREQKVERFRLFDVDTDKPRPSASPSSAAHPGQRSAVATREQPAHAPSLDL